MLTKDMKQNNDVFWKQMNEFMEVGAMLGAGSPEHPGGDSAISDNMIVQNHAYAILDVKKYKGEVILKLRNPHGLSDLTVEWIGDWADDSDKWTEQAINKIGYRPQLLEDPETGGTLNYDGIFWMSHLDFMTEFKYFYACRVLQEKEGWHKREGRDEFDNSLNYSATTKWFKTSQFKITVTKPTTIFVQLRQLGEGPTTFKGPTKVGWILSNEDNARMRKLDRRKIVAKTKVTNLAVLAQQVTFDRSYSYPATFTLVCGSVTCNDDGYDGKFEVTCYCRDEKFKFEKFKEGSNHVE